MLNARASVTCPRPLGVETARITNSLTLSSWEASIIIHELNVVSGGSVEVRHVGKTQCEAVMMRSLRGLHPTLEPPEHGWLQLRSQGRWTSQSGRGQVPKVVLIFLLQDSCHVPHHSRLGPAPSLSLISHHLHQKWGRRSRGVGGKPRFWSQILRFTF